MRYEKADRLLQLALDMQAARFGLSLEDIQERCNVGRRTAQRMRDAILRNFPQAEEVPTSEKVKRWRIPPGVVNRLIAFTADELADLEAAIAVLRRDNLVEQAASVEGLSAKLKAMMKPDLAVRIEPDLEALIEAEGLAMRPGPRPRVRTFVTEDLRQAIKACRQVTLHYRNRTKRTLNKRLVHPYGFLLGHRHYLVGFHVHPKANNFVLFSLPNIERVEVLPEPFARDPDFSLREFAEKSFGVFQEEPFDVVWRFSSRAAADAQDFLFHPTQEMEPQKDGSLIVRFRAGSDLEMAWHLYTWGDDVEVLEPKKLTDMCEGYRKTWPGLP
jgi:predicted DNA-binding transcriptional regulator YafY